MKTKTGEQSPEEIIMNNQEFMAPSLGTPTGYYDALSYTLNIPQRVSGPVLTQPIQTESVTMDRNIYESNIIHMEWLTSACQELRNKVASLTQDISELEEENNLQGDVITTMRKMLGMKEGESLGDMPECVRTEGMPVFNPAKKKFSTV